MLKYTELTKPQQAIIDALKKGQSLYQNLRTMRFIIYDGRFQLLQNSRTILSLIERNYIEQYSENIHLENHQNYHANL